MTNEVDDFLGTLSNNTNNDDPFKQESEDPFASSVTEETQTEEVIDEKPLPFHKDPKVQRFIEKEIGKRISEIKPEPIGQSSNEEDKLTSILERIIGNDTPEKISAVKEFRNELTGLEEKGARRAIQELQAQSDSERQEERQAQEELSDAFENIEENFNVDLTSNTPLAKKTRSDFIDFVKRVSPKDENGDISDYPDFQETFALFKETQRPQNNRAKELASRGMSRSSDASSMPVNSDRSWKAVDKLFSRLKN